jgi:uncharacterized protein (TIGR02646 family)
MIRIPERTLAGNLLRALAHYQAAVDAEATFAEKVALAKVSFGSANAKGNATFDSIKTALDQMCSGARRCMYCEDSAADEIEHFKPKSFYPEQTFSWENYLYACGPCNTGKRENFAVRIQTGGIVYLKRKPRAVPVPPPPGEAVAIHPRLEDPFSYITLDIAGDTFVFRPIPGLDGVQFERAEYTIELLKLNRDVLLRARRDAFKNFLLRLQEYVTTRDRGDPVPALKAIVTSIQRMQHPSVWREMCRQAQSIGMLQGLFDRAPEALNW